MTTKEKIFKIINDLFGSIFLDEEDDIFKTIGMDSLDAADFFLDIEEEFDITISDEEIKDFNTIKDLVSLIEKAKNE